MPRALRDCVVVITGASSGIGRAAAREFAQRGATIVLAARQQQALEAAREDCESRGGRALVVPTDVADAEQVERLADLTVETYDRIDAWINNAAVSLFGRLEETPREAYEAVIRTNLFGYVNGARAAIRRFREQGEGHLINVSSMVAHVGQPYTSAYVASKWAIRGLSECLRMELMDAPDIHVSTLLPASIDTPLFQHAANYTGRAVKPMRPVYPPEQVASALVSIAKHPRREMYVGNAARMIAALHSAAPSLAEAFFARQVEQDHFQPDGVAEASDGNLFAPAADGRGHARGGWLEREHPVQARFPSRLALVAAALAIPLGLLALGRAQQR